MNEHPKFAVIGGGSWATAIAKMLCVNLPEIAWYMRNTDAIEHLQVHKHNPNYLSSVEFDPKKLRLTADINEAVAYADYIVFAIPSAFLNDELKKMTIIESSDIMDLVKNEETIDAIKEHKVIKFDKPYKEDELCKKIINT